MTLLPLLLLLAATPVLAQNRPVLKGGVTYNEGDIFSTGEYCYTPARGPECGTVRFGWQNCPGSRQACDACYGPNGIFAFTPRGSTYTLNSGCNRLNGPQVTWSTQNPQVARWMEEAGGTCEENYQLRGYTCRNVDAGRFRQAATGQSQPQQQHGALYGFLTEFNRIVDSVPGLADALQNGAVVTRRMADETKAQWDLTRSPDQGVRIMIDVLTSELKIPGVGAGSRQAASAVRGHMSHLVGETAQRADDALHSAVAALDFKEKQKIANSMGRLVDPKKIAALKDKERGANVRVNKLIYWTHQAEQKGLDPRQEIRAALASKGVTGREAELIEDNLIQNYETAQVLGILDDPANRVGMRMGLSAQIPGQSDRTSIDHFLPVAMAPEVGTFLGNLKIRPLSVNISRQETVNRGWLKTAKEYRDLNLIDEASYQAIVKAAR